MKSLVVVQLHRLQTWEAAVGKEIWASILHVVFASFRPNGSWDNSSKNGQQQQQEQQQRKEMLNSVSAIRETKQT